MGQKPLHQEGFIGAHILDADFQDVVAVARGRVALHDLGRVLHEGFERAPPVGRMVLQADIGEGAKPASRALRVDQRDTSGDDPGFLKRANPTPCGCGRHRSGLRQRVQGFVEGYQLGRLVHADAFEELRLAALLQKQKHGPAAFDGQDALRLATHGGARALGLQEEVGSLEPGKRADLVVLEAETADMWASPKADLHDVVAFSACRSHVRHVFVEGEALVEDGRLTHLDMAMIRHQAERSMGALLERSGLEL